MSEYPPPARTETVRLTVGTLTLTTARAFAVMTAITGDIPTVARLASTNPARHYGLAEAGRVEPGARADLCVVDDQGELQRVMRAGQWLPPSDPR